MCDSRSNSISSAAVLATVGSSSRQAQWKAASSSGAVDLAAELIPSTRVPGLMYYGYDTKYLLYVKISGFTSTCDACGVVVTYNPPKVMPGVRFSVCVVFFLFLFCHLHNFMISHVLPTDRYSYTWYGTLYAIIYRSGKGGEEPAM